MDYDTYLKLRQTIIADSQRAIDNYDRTIISIAAGAIGLSIAIVGTLDENAGFNWVLLIITWAILGFCLIIELISFLLSYYTHDLQRERLDSIYAKRDLAEQENSPYSRWIRIFNISALIVLVLGLTFFILFTSSLYVARCNLSKTDETKKEVTEKREVIHKADPGYPLPLPKEPPEKPQPAPDPAPAPKPPEK
jgi:hypothetical protein